jgi:tRNA A-37 threonylcarbamoyl transferase component Bud32
MSAPRIADRDLAPIPPATATRASTGERVGAALASPVAILLVMPALVAALGLFLTLLGQRALEESTTQLGGDRFADQTSFIARSIATSLGQADPMLDRMRELATSSRDPPGPLAHALRGLMAGRPGIAYASVSYPDGTFRGTYLHDGVIRFKERRMTAEGAVMTAFDLEATDGLATRATERTDYDPTTRTFYRLAVASGRRVWTAPYTFFGGSQQTGVTRTEAVFEPGPERKLRAVITADFDVHALSGSMAHATVAGCRTLLYAQDGTVLAYPEAAVTIARLPARGDRPISHRDLGDPVIDAFFAHVAKGAGHAAGSFVEFSVSGATELAMVAPVPAFPELGWSVAAIVPSNAFFRGRIEHQRQSLLTASFGLLFALGAAVVFARHVVRVRRDAAVARAIARAATDRARELGSYRLVERLGQGAMGEVWRAEHRLLARQAAIKLIREEALTTGSRPLLELRERFRREAQTLASLRSRHTIELFDFGITEEGTFFFVMELLDGLDLDTLVNRHGAQPAGRVIHLLLQACSSLAEAHRAGLVHRDVKPANVFLCRAADEVDVVKLLDFGLVQARGEADSLGIGDPADPRLTHAGQHVGTPGYMSPEQVRGGALDGRSDLYSLACVAVWLLSGRMPFEAETAMAMMGHHLYEPLPDLAPFVPGYFPPALDQVLRACLRKIPDERPRDAEALAAVLRSIVLPPDQVWTAERARVWWADHAESKGG